MVLAWPSDCQIALCSLSTGRREIPRSRTSGMMICPAQTMSSLFARAMALPATIASYAGLKRRVPGAGNDDDVDIGMGRGFDRAPPRRRRSGFLGGAAASPISRRVMDRQAGANRSI